MTSLKRKEKPTHWAGLKRLIILLMLLFLIICFPFVLEYILFNGSILGKNIHSEFSNNEWFSFWGSYIGAIGTIMLGLVALIQNKSLADANSELSNIQKNYITNITKPSMRLGEEIHIELSVTEELEMKTNNKTNMKFYIKYKDLNDKYTNEQSVLVNVIFPLLCTSEIPLIDYKISMFKWCIENYDSENSCKFIDEFEFISCNADEYCVMPFHNKENLCCICFNVYDEHNNTYKGYFGDRIWETVREETLFNSFITFNIIVRNQIGLEREFHIEIEASTINSMLLSINKYLIRPIDIN